MATALARERYVQALCTCDRADRTGALAPDYPGAMRGRNGCRGRTPTGTERTVRSQRELRAGSRVGRPQQRTRAIARRENIVVWIKLESYVFHLTPIQ